MENSAKKFYDTGWFMWLTLFLFAPVGIFFMWRNRRFNNVVRIILSIFFAFAFIIIMFGDVSEPTVDVAGKEPRTFAQDNKSPNSTFEGEVDVEVIGNKVIVEVNTNVPDGGIFEVGIFNGDMDMLSECVPVSSGKVVKEFIVPEDWRMGQYGAIAALRFNLLEVKQPEHIIELYGENGEKMMGSLTQATVSGGKNGLPEVVLFPYPSQEAIEEAFYGLLNEFIELSDGLIISIQPHYTDGDWKSVAVTLSDEWYDGADYEKERLAEIVHEVIRDYVTGAGFVEEDELIHVHFYDSYKKKLASPKMLGGFKIER